ncbi:MAG TPA: hypothetical protein VIN03_09515 [Roseateles sp.]
MQLDTTAWRSCGIEALADKSGNDDTDLTSSCALFVASGQGCDW